MGRGRPRTEEDTLVSLFSVEELWEQHVRLARKRHNGSRFKTAEELDTFAPRKFIGVRRTSGDRRQLWRIPEAEDEEAIEEMKWRGLWDAKTLYIRNDYMAKSLYQELIAKGMDEAFPSSPTRPPRFGFHFFRDGDFAAFHNFYGRYAAKRFIDQVLDGNDFTWVDDATIRTTSGDPIITIRAEHFTDMEAVMEHEDSKLEEQWELPIPYTGYARAIRRLPQFIPGEHEQRDDTPTPAKPKRERAPKRAATRKSVGDDMMTIGQLADELGMSAREARGILRKSNTPKPDHGWAWPKNEVDAIRKLLKA